VQIVVDLPAQADIVSEPGCHPRLGLVAAAELERERPGQANADQRNSDVLDRVGDQPLPYLAAKDPFHEHPDGLRELGVPYLLLESPGHSQP
jgi:hypothetical protein